MLIDAFNAAAYLILAAAASWAVMSPRVHLNLLLHIGLVLVATGFLGDFLIVLSPYPPERALACTSAVVHAGLLLCVLGYLRRQRCQRSHQRRASDWVKLQ